jgi:FtsP/CotA-like multicopper oxidase with cupredoxin domain
VVEVYLTARQKTVQFGGGQPTRMRTYNGKIPGPTIEGKVGDTVIVHFANELPEETTIHWHGLEVPANMDGSNISQNAVPPGGTFRYEFKLLGAATYWHHPHQRADRTGSGRRAGRPRARQGGHGRAAGARARPDPRRPFAG